MPTLYLDIESRSKCSLKDSGAWRYCADPSTEPLFLCWTVDDGEVLTWRQGDPKPAPFFAAAYAPAGWTVVAHNYGFELPFCDLILTPRFGFPAIPIECWHCTMRLALANAYPAELGLLSQALGLPYRKDPKAIKALREVSRPRKKGGGWEEDPVKLELVHQRCVTDVVAVWRHAGLRHLDEPERQLQILDAKINARGVRIDRTFVTAARNFATVERNATNVRLAELTDGAVTSVDQVKRLLAAVNARGHKMTTLGKRSVAAVLAHDPDEETRQLLELRRDGARASVRKFAKILNYASDADDRLRGTLTMYGAATGRWTSPGPMLHNLKRNELGAPLSVLDAVCRNDRAHIAQFGSPLAVVANIARGALCARPGHLLFSADLRMIESRVLAWVAGDERKLEIHRDYDRTGDKNREPYRVLATQMLNKSIEEIGENERQLGKFAELAAGFGGGVGAWRRIFDDQRPDAEIERDKLKWRSLHPIIVNFWHRLFKAVRIAVQMRTAVRVNESPSPEIIMSFEDGNLYIILPSGRSLTYPGARLVPGKFENTVDLAFHDNAKKQWREIHEWYGTLVENVVSGIARDLLAEAIVRFEARGFPVVFHWHDDVVCEVPEGAISDAEFLTILLESPSWAAGLPLAGSVHSGPHYLPASDEPAVKAPSIASTETPAEMLVADPVEQAIDAFVAEPAAVTYTPAELRTFERNDAQDELDNLQEHAAPLYEIVELAITTGSAKVICPFHDDSDPSCVLYADHFFCHGCHARGSRMDWLTEVEGMTKAEAAKLILDWDGERRVAPVDDWKTANTARALALWNGGKPITGTLAERYLAETRKIAIERLPDTIADSLRFYDQCPYGKGVKHPCLIGLMMAPDGNPCGIHRIALAELDGKVDKIGRMALGPMGTVRLWPANGRLVVGEGIETTLAAATSIPHRGQPLTPAWAAVRDGGIKQLPVIDGVSELILLVDHDRNGAGQNAAMTCEWRWRQAGREVVQLMPNEPGWDFNDVIMRRRAWAPMIIRDRIINGGVEWIEKPGANVLNTYKPPTLILGDPNKAKRWVDHWHMIYPREADHIIKWLAHRVQYPGVKINHGLLLGSEEQGVGKDTLLMGALFACGGGNYQVIEPKRLLSNYSNFVKHVILQISEIKDTATGDGDHINRFSLYDRLKDLFAAPPLVLHYNDKFLRGYNITNCIGLVLTTNHELGSIYIPDTDRRLFVAWTSFDGKAAFSDQYWKEQFWDWYEFEGGYGHIAAYLRSLDLSDFNPKARPPQTEAWKKMVRHDQPAEEDELADAIDALKRPDALIIAELVASDVKLAWMIEPKTLRSVPHRLGRCGYTSCEAEQNRGRWLINGRRHVIYVKRELDPDAQRKAATALVRKLEAKKETKQ